MQRDWTATREEPDVPLDLYKRLNALDDHILGAGDLVHFARIPFLSVPIAALFQPCMHRSERKVRREFSSSLLRLRMVAPIYVLAAIRQVAGYYSTRVRIEGLEDGLHMQAAQLCVDLAIASVLFPVKIQLRGTRACIATNTFEAPIDWTLPGARSRIKLLDHSNYYIDSAADRCHRASELTGSDMFRQSLERIEKTLSQRFGNEGSREYRKQQDTTYVMFEFFMPLTHEAKLRTVLDSLFYKEHILAMLARIEANELKSHFGAANTFHELSGYVCDWIDQTFAGYSISHVSGRFRADDLNALHRNL